MSRYNGFQSMTTASFAKWAQERGQSPPRPQLQSNQDPAILAPLRRLAQETDWHGLHTYSPHGGWHVILVKPDDAIIFADLAQPGVPLSASQQRWQDALQRVSRHETYTWYADSWPAIEARLRQES